MALIRADPRVSKPIVTEPSIRHNPETVKSNSYHGEVSMNRINYKFTISTVKVKVKVNQSRYRPGVAQRVPGS